MEKITFVNENAPYVSAENLNQMQTNVENAINGIVESGKNDNGTYIKFSDGTLICRGTKPITIDITTSWGSIYFGNYATEVPYPYEFIESPDLTFNVNPSGNSGCFYGSYALLTITKTGFKNFSLFRPTSASSVTAKVNFIAIGKWK